MQLNSYAGEGERGNLAFGSYALRSDFQRLQARFNGRIHLENFSLERVGDRWTIRLWARVDQASVLTDRKTQGSRALVSGTGHVSCSCNWEQGGLLLHRRLRGALIEAVADLVTGCRLGVTACFDQPGLRNVSEAPAKKHSG